MEDSYPQVPSYTFRLKGINWNEKSRKIAALVKILAPERLSFHFQTPLPPYRPSNVWEDVLLSRLLEAANARKLDVSGPALAHAFVGIAGMTFPNVMKVELTMEEFKD